MKTIQFKHLKIFIMKKITMFFLLFAAIVASGSTAYAVESAYCQTVVRHFNIAAEVPSAIKLTISKIDATSMFVEIESNDADPVDLLLVNNGSGAVISEPTVPSAGKLRRTLTWTTAPANVSIELLWSKVSMGGNWMLNTFTVPFDATCSGGGTTPPPPPAVPTINFETVGHDWVWTLFENGTNDASLYAVVPNPSASGINTSASVARYTINANGQPWAGLWSNDLTDFTISASNSIVKVMVYKSVISNFGVKFEGAGGSAFEILVPNTKINEWEELTFDFSSRIGSAVTRLVLLPDFPSARTAGSINHFDNLSFNSSQAPVVVTDPTVAAPTPTVAANNVISLYSHAYTNVAVDTWRTGWSNASHEEVQIAGNATRKYTNLNFVGVETTGANLLDLTGMTHLRLDLWTPDMTTFRIKLVDFGANRVWAGGDDVEHELAFTTHTLSTWNTLNIPLSNFTGLATRASMAQYIFSGVPAGKVFIDNMFFYNGATTGTPSLNDKGVKVFPNPATDQLTIQSNQEIKAIRITNLVGQTVKSMNVNALERVVDLNQMSKGQYIVSLSLKNGQIINQKFTKK